MPETGSTPEASSPFPAFDSEMAEILESFIVETREILEKLAQDLLALEKGSADAGLLNSIFRAVHTIKGTSSFLGLEQMTELAHSLEDVLNKLRRGELEMTPAKMDVMLAAYDILKDLLQRIEQRDARRVALEDILERLGRVARSARTGQETEGAPRPARAAPAPATQGPPPRRCKEAKWQAWRRQAVTLRAGSRPAGHRQQPGQAARTRPFAWMLPGSTA